MTMREKFDKWAANKTNDGLFSPPQVTSVNAPFYYHIWQAAYRAGAEDMREKAAKEAELRVEWPDGFASSIRALPIDA